MSNKVNGQRVNHRYRRSSTFRKLDIEFGTFTRKLRETEKYEEVRVVGGERWSVRASGNGGSRLRLPFGNAAQAGGNHARQRALRRLQEAKEELPQISRLQIRPVEFSLREYRCLKDDALLLLALYNIWSIFVLIQWSKPFKIGKKLTRSKKKKRPRPRSWKKRKRDYRGRLA